MRRFCLVMLVVGALALVGGCSAVSHLSDGQKVTKAFGDIQQRAGVPVETVGPMAAPDGTQFGLFHYQTGQKCITGLVRVEQGVAAVQSGGGTCGGGGETTAPVGTGTIIYEYAAGAKSVVLRVQGQEQQATVTRGFWYLIVPATLPPGPGVTDVKVSR